MLAWEIGEETRAHLGACGFPCADVAIAVTDFTRLPVTVSPGPTARGARLRVFDSKIRRRVSTYRHL